MTVETGIRPVVRAEIDVAAPPERAFDVFTTRMGTWWPADKHIQSGKLVEMGVEPRAGGRMWERNDGGDVCDWGRVLTWDPPREFAFAWLIGADWTPPTGDRPSSRVTVTFHPTEAGTRVELVHDRIDAHGEGWQGMAQAVGSADGWPGVLRAYAEQV
jgi:uncharacterized protein YndB with AHSA1/START domain